MSMTEAPYAFGRRERRGAVLGWRPGQALAGALGAILLVAGVGTDRPVGVATGVAGVVAGVVVATVPVRGRGIDEWVPVLAGFVVRVRRGALCTGASIVEDEQGTGHIRWPDDRATVMVALRHRGLRALSDEPAAFAESVASWLRGIGRASASTWTATLLCTTAPEGVPRDARWADPGCRVREFLAVTADRPVDLAEALSTAGVLGAEQLDVEGLDELLGGRVAPAGGTVLDCEFVARWDVLEGPATTHASFVVEEWPSGAVDEQVLAPLCVARDHRTVTISVSVEEPHRARERAARLRTSAAADRALTTSGGFLASAEATRDDARDAERAAELAAGHGSIRVVATVTLDAVDALALEGAAARLVADSTSCGVRLRRCTGDHRRGMLASVAGWCVP
jgi:hypothetical protein